MLYWTKDLVGGSERRHAGKPGMLACSAVGAARERFGRVVPDTNRGVLWTRINQSRPRDHLRIHPLNLNEAYLTTETTGLWNSTNITSATPSSRRLRVTPSASRNGCFLIPTNPRKYGSPVFGHGMMTASPRAIGPLPGTLQLDATTMGSNGTVALTLQQATPGASYAIQVSTNLINWVSLATNVAGVDGVLQFNDTNAGGFTQRFYRALGQ